MTTPVSPATTYTQAVELTIFDSNQFHEIVNGDAATTVTTASGDIDTVRKALTDNFYFKSPILWSNGSTNTVFNQIYTYTDGTLWFSPFATSTNPISLTINGPYNDTNWKMFTGGKAIASAGGRYIQAVAPTEAVVGDSWYNTTDGRTYVKFNDGTSTQWVEESPQSASEEGAFVGLRVQLTRLASEAGFNLVSGSFEEGGTVSSLGDVLWYQADGKYYSWGGSFNKVVPVNSTPTSSGGIGAGAWVDTAQVALKGLLSNSYGVSLLGAFPSITAMRLASGSYDGQKVHLLSYNDGYYATVTDIPTGGGEFHWVATSVADDDGVRVIAPTGVSVGRWYRKVYGYITPEMGGSKGGDNTYDDGIGIQRCIDLKKYPVQLSGIKYYVDAPLKMYSESVIFTNGNAANSATISKIGTTLGSGTALARSGAKTDNYAINSILNIVHADNTYAYNVKISNIVLEGLNHTTNYGIFAPRCSKLTLENVYILNCQNGYYTYDTWLSKFKSVYCDGTTISTAAAPYLNVGPTAYGWTSTTYGFRWVDDGSGNATGTTCHFDNCWALNVHNGYDIFGLQYSVMNACAADHISNCSYSIRSSRITTNGCGTEDVYGSGSILYFASSKVTLNNFAAYKINGANSNHAALEMDGSTCSVIMNNCEIPDFKTINSAYNIIIQNGAKLSTTFTSLPTNGNTFISYSSGASRIDMSGDVITMTDSSGARYSKGRIRDNDVVEAKNKSVATGGSVIATFTVPSSTAIYYGTIDIDLSWFDSTYPTAGGISKLQAVVYADGGTTFNQSLNTSVNIGAGNGFTTTPSFTLARSGFVWSLTMTPAHGAITVRTITMKLDNGNGVTVAVP